MPITPRCQPSPATTSTVCAPMSGSLSTCLRASATISCSSCWRRWFSSSSWSRQSLDLVGQRLVGREQQARRQIGRAHAPGGVDAGREHEADVVAVEAPAGEPGHLEKRPQPHLVRPARQQVEADLGDDAVLAHQRHDIAERAERGDLHERRQPGVPCPRAGTAPGPASARRRRPARSFSGYAAVRTLRVDHGEGVRAGPGSGS